MTLEGHMKKKEVACTAMGCEVHFIVKVDLSCTQEVWVSATKFSSISSVG